MAVRYRWCAFVVVLYGASFAQLCAFGALVMSNIEIASITGFSLIVC